MDERQVFNNKLIWIINCLDSIGIIAILILAFILQFAYNEPPCPLCILQRAGFLVIGMGFLLNLRFGMRPGHYAIALIGALLTAFIALRQISLHILPGSGDYGPLIFGFHLYTWSFIIAMIIVVLNVIILGIDTQYQPRKVIKPISKGVSILFFLMFLLAVGNGLSVLAECGFQTCPDNPSHYLL